MLILPLQRGVLMRMGIGMGISMGLGMDVLGPRAPQSGR